jgi:hypothetical protein
MTVKIEMTYLIGGNLSKSVFMSLSPSSFFLEWPDSGKSILGSLTVVELPIETLEI